MVLRCEYGSGVGANESPTRDPGGRVRALGRWGGLYGELEKREGGNSTGPFPWAWREKAGLEVCSEVGLVKGEMGGVHAMEP